MIDGWTADATLQPMYRDRMLAFFRNTFQQTGFNPAEDFKPQLLTNGGFDFAATPGDDIFQRLVQNIQDSFAMTAWQLIADGRPFNEVLTTTRFMMTTALKATYLQIEMPRSQAATTITWKVDESGTDIPIEQIVDPTSPNYLTFADVAPTLNNRAPTIVCRGTAGMVNSFNGFSHAVPGDAGPDPAVLDDGQRRDHRRLRPPLVAAVLHAVRRQRLAVGQRAAARGGRDARSCRTTCRRCARRPSWGWRCRASASTPRRRSSRSGTPTTATSTA